MKTLFSEFPEHEREAHLRDNCEAVVQKSVRHEFTDDEIAGLNAEFAADARHANTKREELKAISAKLRGEIKSIESRSKVTLERASRGYDENVEDCYAFRDEESRRIEFYDSKGRLVDSRNMTPEEKQTVIPFKQSKAGGM